MTHENESGIEKLRRVVKLFDYCNESFNTTWTIEELLKLADTCWKSGWDFFPDQYTERQLYEALKWGILPQWDEREKPKYETIPFIHIQSHLEEHRASKLQDNSVIVGNTLELEHYTRLIERARDVWGDDVAAFLMDCFMPEGEPILPGIEDSLSHYTFNPTDWDELKLEWEEFLQRPKDE